jgi:hypothetical protein
VRATSDFLLRVSESANVIRDRESGRSRGFAFIAFADAAAAEAALQGSLNHVRNGIGQSLELLMIVFNLGIERP